MNTYLLKKFDMDMNWLAQDDYHSSLGRLAHIVQVLEGLKREGLLSDSLKDCFQ